MGIRPPNVRLRPTWARFFVDPRSDSRGQKGSGACGKCSDEGRSQFLGARRIPRQQVGEADGPLPQIGARPIRRLQAEQVDHLLRPPLEEGCTLEPGTLPAPPLADADHLAAVHRNLAGTETGEAHHFRPVPPDKRTPMHLGEEAEASEYRRPDVTQPQARAPDIVVPEHITTRQEDIRPEHMTRSQEDTTTTGAAPDQIATSGLQATLIRHPPPIPLRTAEHECRTIDLVEKHATRVEPRVSQVALGDTAEGPLALPVAHAVWPATRSR